MRFIRTTNSQIEFIEANDNGQILNSIGLQLGEVYFQIKNKKVAFYLNDSEKPFDNFIWSTNIPLMIDDEVYETEDEVSEALHSIMNDSFQEQLDQLKQDLAAESARAEEAEEQLDDKIDDETSRAVSAETHLQDEITALSGTVATFDERITRNTNDISALTNTVNAEIARSTGKDGEHDALISGLTNSLNNEISRATSAETSLHNEILAETNRAQVAESGITANLNAEISRATTRENAIDDKVDAEVTRSTAKDASHDAEISGLTTSLQNEINRAVGAENSLRNDLNAEIANRTSGDTLLQSNIDAEEARALAAESALTDAINAEVSRSTAKDASQDALISGLTTSLNNEISRATGTENGLRTDLNAEISARTADVDAEEARALAAESGITANLNLEIQNRINAVSGLTERVADDEAAFGAALVDLNNKINAVSGENASQTIQISGLNASLNTEISRATGVENALRSDLTNETSARTTADTELQTSKADKVSAVASAIYNSTNKTIDFKNISGTVISSVDARDFIKDGMVDTVTISNNNLVITFNTDAGKEDIVISLASIFDPNNYYTKSEINAYSASVETALNSKASQSDLSALSGEVMTISGDVITISSEIATISGNSYTKSEVDTKLGNKTDLSAFTAHTADTSIHVTSNEKETWNGKQDTLVAGENITISGNVISAEGGGGGISSAECQTMIDNSISGKVNVGDAVTSLDMSDSAWSDGKIQLLFFKGMNVYGKEILNVGDGLSIDSGRTISVTGGSQPVDAYTKAESDNKFATITNFNSHSGDTTVHITAQERTTWNAKPNVWCGDETAWSQISGSTQSGTIYLVY